MSFKSARKKAGFSVNEIAEYLHMTRVSIWNWENGNSIPHADVLVKLADKYGCSVDDLLRKEE